MTALGDALRTAKIDVDLHRIHSRADAALAYSVAVVLDQPRRRQQHVGIVGAELPGTQNTRWVKPHADLDDERAVPGTRAPHLHMSAACDAASVRAFLR